MTTSNSINSSNSINNTNQHQHKLCNSKIIARNMRAIFPKIPSTLDTVKHLKHLIHLIHLIHLKQQSL